MANKWVVQNGAKLWVIHGIVLVACKASSWRAAAADRIVYSVFGHPGFKAVKKGNGHSGQCGCLHHGLNAVAFFVFVIKVGSQRKRVAPGGGIGHSDVIRVGIAARNYKGVVEIDKWNAYQVFRQAGQRNQISSLSIVVGVLN